MPQAIKLASQTYAQPRLRTLPLLLRPVARYANLPCLSAKPDAANTLGRSFLGAAAIRNAKAFCLLTRQQRVLILPQRDGASLLLSPEHPQALLDALRQAQTQG